MGQLGWLLPEIKSTIHNSKFKTCQHWWWWVGWELICLWVGDVEICQELMTFMILFGFLSHSLVSVLIRFLNKTNDTCVNSTENGFTKRH